VKHAPVNQTEELFVRSARRAGLSDGYYGYPADTGDWPDRACKAYLDAHEKGTRKNRNGEAW
jgi:hypothetical protein